MARPNKLNAKQISISLPSQLITDAQKQADADKNSFSAIVAYALNKHLESLKK